MEFTKESITHTVPVAEFRSLTDRLWGQLNNYHSCVGKAEKTRWVSECQAVAKLVREAGCKRAQELDWEMRERALDVAATRIGRVLYGAL